MKKSFLTGIVWGIIAVSSLLAQAQLERISISERSDGNGYVIRYHLTEMVDLHELIQPEANLIQMELISPGMNTEGVRLPGVNEDITDVELIPLENGIGIHITTGEGRFFRASAYPDQNLRDLLLNLEYTTQENAEEIASASERFAWSVADVDMEPETVPEPEETAEEIQSEPEREVQRNPLSVNFGVAGGLGIANKLGGGYSSEPRQEFTTGITASINLPFVFRNIHTGIETGIFYTQKGFQHPSDIIEAQTVILDYIEVPVMAKLQYDLNETVKPALLGGFYTAFRTAAEAVEDDGDRNDLKEVTNRIDIGLVAGIGTDFFVLENTTISTQVRYSIGLPRMFDEGFSGRERPGHLSLLLGFRF